MKLGLENKNFLKNPAWEKIFINLLITGWDCRLFYYGFVAQLPKIFRCLRYLLKTCSYILFFKKLSELNKKIVSGTKLCFNPVIKKKYNIITRYFLFYFNIKMIIPRNCNTKISSHLAWQNILHKHVFNTIQTSG